MQPDQEVLGGLYQHPVPVDTVDGTQAHSVPMEPRVGKAHLDDVLAVVKRSIDFEAVGAVVLYRCYLPLMDFAHTPLGVLYHIIHPLLAPEAIDDRTTWWLDIKCSEKLPRIWRATSLKT